MSFENIVDPKKREELFKQYIESKNNIKQNFLNERVGNIEMKRETTKLFSPIIESQQKVGENTEKAIFNITKELPKILSITDKVLPRAENLPENKQLLNFSKQLAIELPTLKFNTLGPTALKYLLNYYNNEKLGDSMFGIRNSNERLYVGNKEVKIDNDDIIIDGIKYNGTPGLWELLTMKTPKTYTLEDEDNYRKILYFTDARYYPSYNSNEKPVIKNSIKHKFIKDKIDHITVIQYLPPESGEININKLLERYALLLASKESGNTGVNDEMISIVNTLKDYISENEYEIMMSQATG